MDRRGDLDLTVDGDGESARSEEVGRGSLVGRRALALHDYVHIVCELVELLLVDEAVALVDQDVSVLGLVSPLVVQDLLHAWVMCVMRDLRFPVLILPTECLLGDVPWIEMHNMCVIELVPLAILILALLSILDEGVIVASFRSAVVHHNALQLILEVIVCHCAI